jgi:hypothetical protein
MIHRYLVEASDNPFLLPVDAHHDISFACIVYLRMSLEIIDPCVPEERRMINIGKGSHALQLYAHEYWATHLLIYSKLNGGFEEGTSQPLMEQLLSLCEVHKQIKPQLTRVSKVRDELHAVGDAEHGLLCYLSNAGAREMVQATLRLRKLSKNGHYKTGKGMFLDFLWR